MTQTLARRASQLTGAVAAVVVLIAGPVSLPLVRDAAQNQAQASLANQADLVQQIALAPHDFDADGGMGGRGGDDRRALVGVVNYLRVQGIEVEAIVPGTSVPTDLTSDDVRAIHAGESVSTRSCRSTQCVFVEARPVGVGTGIALVQPTSVVASVTSTAIGRIGLALVIGFVVAVLIGQWFARRLSRPLAQAARAAHELAAGERGVRLVPEGPAEVAEIAVALNVLSEELAVSEGRQREFFLSISHELRTPLTAIRGYAEAMEDGLLPADDIAGVGTVMSAETSRMERLVSDLLDLARTGAVDFPLHLGEVELGSLLREAAEVWATRAAREDVVFRADLTSEPVWVRTDPVRVRQVIDNLAENALRVTPAGAPIVLALTADGIVEVRDGGPGLSSDDLAVAFEPGELYERYKGVRRVGTGFGLALVGRLAQRLGVTARAGVAPEGGAAFSLDFSAVLQPPVD